jgi:DNA repair protein RecO (recombination protein O)
MEVIKDIGFVCKVEQHGNTSCVVHLFSKNHGMVSGYFKGGMSKQKHILCTVGNLIEFTWEARVISQLGSVSASLIENFSTVLQFAPLSIVNAVCEILTILFHKNDSHLDIFDAMLSLFCFLKESHEKVEYFEQYVLFENSLMRHLGFGYNFDECNVSGEKPKFISPKTGNAVSQKVAVGFEDRLFIIPDFILLNTKPTLACLHKMLDINLHFINLHLDIKTLPVRSFMINIFK